MVDEERKLYKKEIERLGNEKEMREEKHETVLFMI